LIQAIGQANGEEDIKSSPVRWYMLTVSCLIAFQQGQPAARSHRRMA
jgi:hypothetical protein